MPPSAHAALVISIIASALGALVMCLLVARYGLTPAANEDADAAARRLIITRFGHALAGVCFVATGVLGLVAVTVQTRQAPPPETTTVVVHPDRAAEARLQALAAELKTIATRLEQTESRVATVDGATRRLGDDVASVNLRARQMERAIAAPPRRAAAPEPPARLPRDAGPSRELVREPDQISATPAPTSPERPTAALPPTVEQQTPSRTVPAAVRHPEPRTPPPAARAPEPAVSPRALPTAARTSEPAAMPRTQPPSARAAVEAPPRSAEGSASPAKPEDLGDKLRDDWKTIRGGFSTAGEEFKAAVRDLSRKFWR
jgi:hypothetical protein